MRAPFDTTADFFFGPNTPTPGVLRGTAAIRLVLRDGIVLMGAAAPADVGWCTLDSFMPDGSFGPSPWQFDGGLGDQVAIPSGTAVQWYVTWVDGVSWNLAPSYWRANLALLPPPLLPHPFVNGGTLPPFSNVINLGGAGPWTSIVPGMRVFDPALPANVTVISVVGPLATITWTNGPVAIPGNFIFY